MPNEIKVGDQKVENVKEFVYLGSLLTWDNDCTKEIKRWIAKAKGVIAGFNNIWKSKQISHKTKLNILKTCVFSTALYACEAWRLKKTDRDKILAFEMYCYRRSSGATRNLSWGVLNFSGQGPPLPSFPLPSILLPPPALDALRPR